VRGLALDTPLLAVSSKSGKAFFDKKVFFKEKFSKTRRNGKSKAKAYFHVSRAAFEYSKQSLRRETKYSEIYQRKIFTRGILVLKYAPDTSGIGYVFKF